MPTPRPNAVPGTTTLPIATIASVALFTIDIGAVWVGSRLLAGHYSDRNATPA